MNDIEGSAGWPPPPPLFGPGAWRICANVILTTYLFYLRIGSEWKYSIKA